MYRFTFPFGARALFWAAFLPGVGSCLVAAGSQIYFTNFLKTSLVATGTITSTKANDNGFHCPEFRFDAADTKTYTVTSHTCTDPSEFSVGERVAIRYKQNDPNDALIDSPGQLRNLPGFEEEMGAAALLVAFAARWYARKKGISLAPW